MKFLYNCLTGFAIIVVIIANMMAISRANKMESTITDYQKYNIDLTQIKQTKLECEKDLPRSKECKLIIKWEHISND